LAKPRLLILSYAFAPSIGGIETVSDLVARGLARRSVEVTIVTVTPQAGPEAEAPFRVVRGPGPWRLLREMARADRVLASNLSLRLGWPLWCVFLRKPFVLVHHTTVARTDGRLAWQDRLKLLVLGRARRLAVSRFLAEKLHAGLIRNPYDKDVFHAWPEIARDRELLFVGRLVYAKGVDILLRAMRALVDQRPQTRLTIIGSGPEQEKLQALAVSLGLAEVVEFLGAKWGEELARWMNRAKILVVPSRSHPPEICPVVPVEAIACGCVPVASRMGGLPESVGAAGVLVEEGNAMELASVLLQLLEAPERLETYRTRAAEHLRLFDPETVADVYEAQFAACGRRR
jgi:glycosyltransferase involved in cell wall biosynthesis